MHLRDAVIEDFELLAGLVVEAVNWTGETRMTGEQVMAEPELNHYVTGWKRPTDFGLVAVDDDDAPLGAIWARVFPDNEPGYGFVARDIPELSMAVLPGRRGKGVGGALLRACIERAQTAGCSALSLSVEDGNDVARRLYERHHFRKRIPERAPEAMKDLRYRRRGCWRPHTADWQAPHLETVTTGTFWSLVRQPVTRHDNPERTPWTSCRGCRECCPSWRPPPAAPTTASNGNHGPHAYRSQRRPRRSRRPRGSRLPQPRW